VLCHLRVSASYYRRLIFLLSIYPFSGGKDLTGYVVAVLAVVQHIFHHYILVFPRLFVIRGLLMKILSVAVIYIEKVLIQLSTVRDG